MKKLQKSISLLGVSALVFLACPSLSFAATNAGTSGTSATTSTTNTNQGALATGSTGLSQVASYLGIGPGFYVSAYLGYDMPSSLSKGFGTTPAIKMQPWGVSVLGSVGYRLPSIVVGGRAIGAFRFSGDVNYIYTRNKKAGDPAADGIKSASFNYGSLIASATFDVNTNTPIVPYIGVGFGGFVSQGYNKTKDNFNKGANMGVGGLAMQWNLGAKYNVTPSLALEGQYRMETAWGKFVKDEDGKKHSGTLLNNIVFVGLTQQF